MVTVMSSKGQVVIPGACRKKLGWRAGDCFEIIECPEADSVTFKKVAGDADWVDTLLACPDPIEIPPRSTEIHIPRS
jgi:AbrB family looped-hinge helix DNA binding protein